MHTELDREKMLKHLDLLVKITTKQQTLPVLQCVLIETKEKGVRLTATNLELGMVSEVDANVKEEGVVAVPALLLLQTIQLLSNKTISLKTEEGVLIVDSKTSNTKIKTLSVDEFPKIPKLTTNTQTLNGALFSSGMRAAVFASSHSTIKPELGSVYIHQKKEHTLTFVATDSFRLVEKTVPQRSVVLDAPLLVPQKNALEIIRVLDAMEEDPDVAINENQAAFLFKQNNVYITTRLTEGSFPDYQQIIPKEYTSHATLLITDLLQALKKTNVFANKFMQVSFFVDVKKGILTISAENSDVGQTTEQVQASIEGEDLSLSFNQRYVSDPLSYFGGESVVLHFGGIGRPMVMEGVSEKSFRYLVMPMNK